MSPASGLGLVSLVVSSYDEAIAFFVEKLGFDLVEDSPAFTTVGKRPKRWVVIRPPNSPNGADILLAQADGPDQEAVVGRQFGGRVGFFWRVDEFEATYQKMVKAGVEFVEKPRTETFGQVAVFLDLCGNKWDLIEPSKS